MNLFLWTLLMWETTFTTKSCKNLAAIIKYCVTKNRTHHNGWTKYQRSWRNLPWDARGTGNPCSYHAQHVWLLLVQKEQKIACHYWSHPPGCFDCSLHLLHLAQKRRISMAKSWLQVARVSQIAIVKLMMKADIALIIQSSYIFMSLKLLLNKNFNVLIYFSLFYHEANLVEWNLITLKNFTELNKCLLVE